MSLEAAYTDSLIRSPDPSVELVEISSPKVSKSQEKSIPRDTAIHGPRQGGRIGWGEGLTSVAALGGGRDS